MKPPKSVEVGLLEEWEAARPPGRSRAAHEQAWPQAPQLRADLDTTRAALAQWAALLAVACGIPDLSAAMPKPPAGS